MSSEDLQQSAKEYARRKRKEAYEKQKAYQAEQRRQKKLADEQQGLSSRENKDSELMKLIKKASDLVSKS